MTTSHWVDWHQDYDDPGSMLSRRLAAVVAMLGRVFDDAQPGPIRVLSLCAGEARDLSLGLSGHPRAGDVTGMAVESDPVLADRARASLAAAGLAIEVRTDDAGQPDVWGHAVPVDVLVLCGIFGNISTADIAATIDAVPSMCRPAASVLWTRHRRHPDVIPWIRQRFDHAGCPAVDLVSAGPGGFALGHQRVTAPPPPRSELRPPSPDRRRSDHRLFTFTTTASAWGAEPGAGCQLR